MTTALRVLLGAAIYLLIVLLAAPFPAAAGLMLTFPTLNGLAFVFARREEVPGMARSMIWMPVLNTALCAGFIVVFLLLAPRMPATPLAWSLVAIGVALFFAIGFLPKVRAGVVAESQLRFALLATVVGALLLAGVSLLAGRPPAAGAPAFLLDGFVWNTLAHNAPKIALFALCLLGFLVATARLPLSDGVRGVLAGLPFVPLGGLVSVAADAGLPLDARLDIFRGMAASVWFAAVAPVWFIYGFSRYLLAMPAGGGTDVSKLIVLVAAWALCALAIAAVAFALAG